MLMQHGHRGLWDTGAEMPLARHGVEQGMPGPFLEGGKGSGWLPTTLEGSPSPEKGTSCPEST